MRAVTFNKFGSLEVLEIKDIPVPRPGVGEVLVRVKAVGLNFVDILTRKGELPNKIKFPHISGSEVTGDIVELGEGINNTDFEPGLRVVVNPHLYCGKCEYCLNGEDNVCLHGGVFGIMTQGGYAEYVVAPVQNIFPLPEVLSYEEAAAILVAAPTAYHMLIDRGKLKKGETVLIIAGGSGIGSYAIQIAKQLGANVIATAGSVEKRKQALSLGADHVIDHSEPGWSKEVRSLTNKRGVDLVFEHVGGATWDNSVKSMARNGRLVTCGGHTGFDVSINLWNLFAKQLSLIGSFSGTNKNLLEILRMAEQGVIKPIIYDIYPLEKIHEAQKQLENRNIFGKLIIKP